MLQGCLNHDWHTRKADFDKCDTGKGLKSDNISKVDSEKLLSLIRFSIMLFNSNFYLCRINFVEFRFTIPWRFTHVPSVLIDPLGEISFEITCKQRYLI